MLNGVDLNYIIELLVTGAVLMAAVYHSILYFHNRRNILSAYSVYLWATFFYCTYSTYRTFFFNAPLSQYVSLDEALQMTAFVMYIRFAAIALDLDATKEKYATRFVLVTPYVVGFYILIHVLILNLHSVNMAAYVTAKTVIRAYLLLIGLSLLIIIVRRRQSVYYRYLAAGAGAMILCGMISSVLNLAVPPSASMLGALSWLMFGFFLDVVLFSSAIGYKIRQEYNERKMSLKQLLHKEAELQQKEMEKIKAVYETREEERLRIARDLHDDMGSTLSSISIYSKVVSSYLENDRQKAEDYLKKIENNSRLLMENTSDLIWSLQTNYGETESIFRRMQKTAMELLSSANITPHTHIQEGHLPSLSITAQKNCWLIFKEAINNVCKYSKASNCILEILSNNEVLEISVRDDGTGFSESKMGNGLKNMAARASALGGECIIESSKGLGTLVKAILPIRKILNPLSIQTA
jgi:signal transduction histidine kinase